MRPIDADELKKYSFNVYQANGVEIEELMVVPVVCIDNAPTIELFIARGSSGVVIPVTRQLVESLLSQYQHDSMSGVFAASPTEVIKTDEPLSNSEEITKAFKNGEIYKRGKEEWPKKEGEWLWVGHDGDKLKWSCSSCGRAVENQENFCPNCGADMRKDVGDNETDN